MSTLDSGYPKKVYSKPGDVTSQTFYCGIRDSDGHFWIGGQCYITAGAVYYPAVWEFDENWDLVERYLISGVANTSAASVHEIAIRDDGVMAILMRGHIAGVSHLYYSEERGAGWTTALQLSDGGNCAYFGTGAPACSMSFNDSGDLMVAFCGSGYGPYYVGNFSIVAIALPAAETDGSAKGNWTTEEIFQENYDFGYNTYHPNIAPSFDYLAGIGEPFFMSYSCQPSVAGTKGRIRLLYVENGAIVDGGDVYEVAVQWRCNGQREIWTVPASFSAEDGMILLAYCGTSNLYPRLMGFISPGGWDTSLTDADRSGKIELLTNNNDECGVVLRDTVTREVIMWKRGLQVDDGWEASGLQIVATDYNPFTLCQPWPLIGGIRPGLPETGFIFGYTVSDLSPADLWIAAVNSLTWPAAVVASYTFPSVPAPNHVTREEIEYKTQVRKYESGVEDRSSLWATGKSKFRLVYKALSSTNFTILWDFYQSVFEAGALFTFTNPLDSETYTCFFEGEKMPKEVFAAILYDTGIVLIEAF